MKLRVRLHFILSGKMTYWDYSTKLVTTLPYLFVHSSQLEFQNLDFFIPCRSLYRKLSVKLLNSKNPISYSQAMSFIMHVVDHVSHYLIFYTRLPYLSFTPLSSSFGIWIFSSHVVAYIVSFDSSSWSQKSDIIRPRYELFNACCGSCLSLCSLLHNITLPFHSLLSVRVLEFGFFYPTS